METSTNAPELSELSKLGFTFKGYIDTHYGSYSPVEGFEMPMGIDRIGILSGTYEDDSTASYHMLQIQSQGGSLSLDLCIDIIDYSTYDDGIEGEDKHEDLTIAMYDTNSNDLNDIYNKSRSSALKSDNEEEFIKKFNYYFDIAKDLIETGKVVKQ